MKKILQSTSSFSHPLPMLDLCFQFWPLPSLRDGRRFYPSGVLWNSRAHGPNLGSWLTNFAKLFLSLSVGRVSSFTFHGFIQASVSTTRKMTWGRNHHLRFHQKQRMYSLTQHFIHFGDSMFVTLQYISYIQKYKKILSQYGESEYVYMILEVHIPTYVSGRTHDFFSNPKLHPSLTDRWSCFNPSRWFGDMCKCQQKKWRHR